MNDRQKELARHALGLDGKRKCSYRNGFTATKGTDSCNQWIAMVASGDAEGIENKGTTGDAVRFWLTPKGAATVLIPGESLDPEDFPAGSIDASGLPICREVLA